MPDTNELVIPLDAKAEQPATVVLLGWKKGKHAAEEVDGGAVRRQERGERQARRSGSRTSTPPQTCGFVRRASTLPVSPRSFPACAEIPSLIRCPFGLSPDFSL